MVCLVGNASVTLPCMASGVLGKNVFLGIGADTNESREAKSVED